MAGDETGVANLRLKGELVEKLVEGTVIAIRNGRVMIVKGHIRLEIDRWGKVTVEVSLINFESLLSKESCNNKRDLRLSLPCQIKRLAIFY